MSSFQRALARKVAKIGKSKRLPLKVKNWKLFKGDFVKVISGGGKGEYGPIVDLCKYTSRVWVKGVKMRRRLRNNRFVLMESPIHYSNVMLVDPELKKPTRVRWRFTEDGTNVRVSVKSGAVIPLPDQSPWEDPIAPVNKDKDTEVADAFADTYSAAVAAMEESLAAEEASVAGEGAEQDQTAKGV